MLLSDWNNYWNKKIEICVAKLPFYHFTWVALIFIFFFFFFFFFFCGRICYIIITIFVKFQQNMLKKFEVIEYISNLACFKCSPSCLCFLNMSVHPSIHPSIHPLTYLPACLPASSTYLPIYLPHQPTYLSTYLINLPIYLPTSSTYLSTYLLHQPACLPTYLPAYLSVFSTIF